MLTNSCTMSAPTQVKWRGDPSTGAVATPSATDGSKKASVSDEFGTNLVFGIDVSVSADELATAAEHDAMREALLDFWMERETSGSALAAVTSAASDTAKQTAESFHDVFQRADDTRTYFVASHAGAAPLELPRDRLATSISFKGYLNKDNPDGHQRTEHKVNNIILGVYAGEVD